MKLTTTTALLLLAIAAIGCVRRPCSGPRAMAPGVASPCTGTEVRFRWNGRTCEQASPNDACLVSYGCADFFETKEACAAAYTHCGP